MAARVLTRFVSRALPQVSGAKGAGVRRAHRAYWTTSRGTAAALTSGSVAFVLGLPALSCLGYGAYHWVQSSAVLHASGKEEVLEQADYLYSCADTEKLYQLLLQYKDSDEAEVLWRLARASRDLSLLPNMEAKRKKQLINEAFEYARRALEKDDQCFAAHKWYAVCLSDVGDYEGIKVKIGNSYIIREHLERAVELNPKDATSLHILGYWCFAFAELPWYQRKVAAALFSSPPVSTYEEALEFFLKAEEVDPDFYSKNLLMLGKTYLAMKDKQKALMWLTKAKEYPAHTLEDKDVHKEAVDLLKRLG
ncbi:regulator of microtubule dynamics protein 1 [Hippoglossus hippoglossus]|uniref:regulator of microtubule dynamics protein 1 n=1 Tax=Hippoglossus hippoglossus TaxID=8267 RepID=UPI00148D4A5F|nr:regulator of microtubule dynamics protein 1 [Hippoglossus hippoglossus]XP_034998593.1 regulator of microtubule dynamics protein 1 [Hippoglossus stenolepis]